MSEGHGSGSHGADAPTPSAGIAPVMWLFIGLSILVAIWQGSNVVRASDYGKVWPSTDAVKVPLPPEQH